MLNILNAKILADERERDIRRQLRDHALRREAEAARAEAAARSAAPSDPVDASRLRPDCPCRVTALAQ